MAVTGGEEAGFLREKHIGYFAYSLQCLPSAYESQDVNRLTLTYFCVAGLDLLDSLDQVDTGSIVDWVYSLQVLPPQSPEQDANLTEAGANSTKSGSSSTKAGFRGSPWIGIEHSEDGAPLLHQYDGATLAMTYSALATLATLGALDLNRLNRGGMLQALAALQQPNGSFLASQESGEDDVRFAFCAAAICTFLGGCGDVDVDKAVAFLRSCQAYDGGFGLHPGLEAHGGATYCAAAALQLFHRLRPPPKGPSAAAASPPLDSPQQQQGLEGKQQGWGDKQGALGDKQEALVDSVSQAVGGMALQEHAKEHAEEDAKGLQRGTEGAESLLLEGREKEECLGALGCDSRGAQGSPVWLGGSSNSLLHWIVNRQTGNGGFQGRRNKDPDTCYAFWLGAVLGLLGKNDLPQREDLTAFLFTTQHQRVGGFSKYPGGHPDVLHSYYGIAGLSLTGLEGLKPLAPGLGVSEEAAKGILVHL